VVFTNDGRQNRDIDKWIGKANSVLRELYRLVVAKRKLSNTAKLLVFKSVFVPMLTYDDEFWVMTERVLSQGQAAEMVVFRRVHAVRLSDKVHSSNIR